MAVDHTLDFHLIYEDMTDLYKSSKCTKIKTSKEYNFTYNESKRGSLLMTSCDEGIRFTLSTSDGGVILEHLIFDLFMRYENSRKVSFNTLIGAIDSRLDMHVSDVSYELC